MTASLLYGVLAEFEDSHQLLHAAEHLREQGYVHWEAYTPFPVEGLADAVGFSKSRLPLVVLVGAILGGCLGFAMQYGISVEAYPLNIGGRPLNSWPSFIPVTFELTILGGALSAVLGMLGLNGLPRPHHPLFDVEGFRTGHGYYICIQSRDEKFDDQQCRELLMKLHARNVWDVPQEL